LFLNLRTYCEKINQNVFDVVPLTFILDFKSESIWDNLDHFKQILKIIDSNSDSDISTINKKLRHLQSIAERKGGPVHRNQYKMSDCAYDQKNIWLLKPTGLNRGRGIHIFRTFEELRKIMREHYDISTIGIQPQP
jgi:hypothetical protein